MSQSALYQVLGVYGYQVSRIERADQTLILHATPQPHRICCSACGSREVVHRGQKQRQLRHVPIGSACTWLFITVPRVACRDCGLVRQISLGLAEPRYAYTRAFERYVLELCQRMTIQDVADHLSIGWDTIKDIHKRYLQKHYSKPSLKGVRRIGIDEICIGRGHRYLTIVLDWDSGAILFAGEGKSAESLQAFWRRVRAGQTRIRAVAMDMSAAYQLAVRENLPEAAIVFDRFHVIKLFNEKLTALRRQLHGEATSEQERKVLKGTRWLLLKNPENLDPLKGEPGRLRKALELNEPLAIAYYLKADLKQLWEQPDKKTARRKLYDWYHQAVESGIAILKTFAATLLYHKEGILAWYDHPISNGPLEGTNNKIKTMNRQHYGLRDQEFFRLKLYQLHETKYALVG